MRRLCLIVNKFQGCQEEQRFRANITSFCSSDISTVKTATDRFLFLLLTQTSWHRSLPIGHSALSNQMEKLAAPIQEVENYSRNMSFKNMDVNIRRCLRPCS